MLIIFNIKHILCLVILFTLTIINHQNLIFGNCTTITTNHIETTTITTTTTIMMTRMSKSQIWSSIEMLIENLIPPLTSKAYKGQMGRIGILGGSPEYTGAPYYAAISSLKSGADLSYVFTAMEAVSPIKSYSPELMVVPIYSSNSNTNNNNDFLIQNISDKVIDYLPRLHSLVIGPGLGRNTMVHQAMIPLIQEIRNRKLPLIIDADGLFLVTNNLYVIQNYSLAILTPNHIEYKRLRKAVLLLDNNNTSNTKIDSDELATEVTPEEVMDTARRMGNVIIVLKGVIDIITDGNDYLICDEVGGLKRSGGIGDILSGTIGLFSHWSMKARQEEEEEIVKVVIKENEAEEKEWKGSVLLWGCWGACTTVRRATKLAFHEKRRSMTAPDIIDKLGNAFEELYPLQQIVLDDVDDDSDNENKCHNV